MKPIEFKDQNILYKKPEYMKDEKCKDLPALRHRTGNVSCWKATFRERLKILLTGIVWMDVITPFQPPVWIGVDKPYKKGD